MNKTRVLQERSANGLKIKLEDDVDNVMDYRVTVSRTFSDFYAAMDFVRQIEREARNGKDVSFTGD